MTLGGGLDELTVPRSSVSRDLTGSRQALALEEHADRSLLGSAQLGCVAVPARREGLEAPERAGGSLEQQPAVARYLEGEQRSRSPEIDQIQAIGSDARSEDEVERVQVGRTVATHRDVEVTSGSRPALGRGTEQDNELEGRFHLAQVGETLGHDLRGDHEQDATVSDIN